jgi:hypothetical protein
MRWIGDGFMEIGFHVRFERGDDFWECNFLLRKKADIIFKNNTADMGNKAGKRRFLKR